MPKIIPALPTKFLDTIKHHFRQITERAELGRSRDELAPGLRSLVVRRYRRYLILYIRKPDVVQIVRVLAGSRDLKRIFERS